MSDPTPATVRCPHCLTLLNVRPDPTGGTADCPRCEIEFHLSPKPTAVVPVDAITRVPPPEPDNPAG